MLRVIRTLVAAWVLLGLEVSRVWACPMCKMAVEANDPQPRAYMYSILFMLGAFGLVAGGVTMLLCWINRAEQAALQKAGYEHLFENAVTEAARR